MYTFGEEKVHTFECVLEEQASFGTYYHVTQLGMGTETRYLIGLGAKL